MLVNKIDGFYVVYKGKIFVTPKGKFTWSTTGAAKNAVSAHPYIFGTHEGVNYYSLGYMEQKEFMTEVKRHINVLPVNLSVEV